jgi:hypothetical protein
MPPPHRRHPDRQRRDTVTGVTVNNNLIVNNGSAGSGGEAGIKFYNGASGALILNNTIYGNKGYGIWVTAGANTNILQNNHVIGNTGAAQIKNDGTGTTQTTNRTPGTITDCTVSTSDFTQNHTSSCINGGTARAGFAFNTYSGKTKPDQGAFEVFKCNAAGTVNANFMDTTCALNLNTPVLPNTGITGMVALLGGVARGTTSSAVLAGTDSVVRTIFDGAACLVGGVWTNTYTAGNLTDSALIGSTRGTSFNQKAITSTALTVSNACSASVPTTFTPVASSTFTRADESPLTELGVWTVTNGGLASMQIVSGTARTTSRDQ